MISALPEKAVKREIGINSCTTASAVTAKIGAARKFLSKGDRVKVTLRFRGREMAHMQNSKHILDDFAEALSEVAVVDKAPKVEG